MANSKPSGSLEAWSSLEDSQGSGKRGGSGVFLLEGQRPEQVGVLGCNECVKAELYSENWREPKGSLEKGDVSSGPLWSP